MLFQTGLPLLLLSTFAVVAPALASADNSSDHTPTALKVDAAILSRLEALFQAAAAPSNSSSTVVARTSSDTRDDINNGLCGDIVIIFARGTYGYKPNAARDEFQI